MTDNQLRDAAVAHLKRTTVGYVNHSWKVPPSGSEWAAALALLAQIGAQSPTPPPLTGTRFSNGTFATGTFA